MVGKSIYKDVGVYEHLHNILCVYYHRMIKSHCGHPRMTEPGWQNHKYPLKTEHNLGPEKRSTH